MCWYLYLWSRSLATLTSSRQNFVETYENLVQVVNSEFVDDLQVLLWEFRKELDLFWPLKTQSQAPDGLQKMQAVLLLLFYF